MPAPLEQNRFRSYYAAKLAREAREHPTHWANVPTGNGWHELRKIGGLDEQPTTR